MAYRNLLGIECANRAEVFKRFRDFVCRRNGSYDYSTTGIGWTLHDSYYATDENNVATNDWFVIYSAGENGHDDIYYKVTLSSTTGIKITGYLYWDASTNSGTQGYAVWENWSIPDAYVPVLWVYGDLDQVFSVTRENTSSSTYTATLFGVAVNPMYSRDVATCSGALTAGTDVSINVGTVPSSWKVGQKIFIRDTVNVARITITAKTASTITATLATDYLAGAKLTAELNYFAPSSTTFTSSPYSLITHAGTKAADMGSWQNSVGIPGFSPETLNADLLIVPYYSYVTSVGYHGELKHVFKSSSAHSALTLYQDVADGTSYRAFTIGSNYVAVKEV